METEFRSKTHPLFGNFDLVIDGRIIDYKTGRSYPHKDIMNKMDVNMEQDFYEFQPLIYLSLLRDNSPPPYRFSLVYVADNDIRSVTDDRFSIVENVRNVILTNDTIEEFLLDPDCPIKDQMVDSYNIVKEQWTLFVSKALEKGIDRCSQWRSDDSLVDGIINSLCIKPTKGNKDTVAKVLGKLADVAGTGMYHDDREVVVPSDTLERFLSIVDRDHSSASTQTYTEFPAAPRRNCSSCDFFKACTKDIIDLKEDENDE